MRVVHVLMGITLVIGLTARVNMLRGDHLRDRGSDRAERELILGDLTHDSASAFRFDPAVAVIIACGPDGAPGRAEVDDNANGIVDDRREIGAVGSDDQCLAPADLGYEAALQAEGTVTISRGAMTPSGSGEPTERWFTRRHGWIVVE